MALFDNNQTAQILIQGAQLLNQTLQFQQQQKQRQQEFETQMALREKALKAKEREMKATQEASTLELQTELLKFKKLQAETELKVGDLRNQLRKDMHLKLSAEDPVQTNRRFQDLSQLTSERNRLSGSLDRFQRDFLAADSPRVEELRNQIDQVDTSIKFRLERLAGEGVDKEEALIPIKVEQPRDQGSAARTGPAPIVRSATATSATADRQSGAVAITELYGQFTGGKGTKKQEALDALKRTFVGASAEAQTAMLNQLGAALLNQGLSRDAAKAQLNELRRQMRE